jgi:hypothetical protein
MNPERKRRLDEICFDFAPLVKDREMGFMERLLIAKKPNPGGIKSGKTAEFELGQVL